MSRDLLRDLMAPGYLFLCLLAGGSGQGIWANAILQLLAIAILVAAVVLPRTDRDVPIPARRLILLVTVAVLLLLAQLVPLPAGLWTHLPGRWPAVEAVGLLGIAPGWRPLSLTPYDTIAAALCALPPLAMLAAIAGLGSRRWSWIGWAVVAAAIAGILLGVLQVGGGSDQRSPYYLYPITNVGVATGFFANGNHMASLLLATLPFAAAIGGSFREDRTSPPLGPLVLAIGVMATIAAGILLNGSLAGLGLALPVALASFYILFAPLKPSVRKATIVGVVLSLLLVIGLWLAGAGAKFGDGGAGASLATRSQISATSIELLRSFGLLGSGLGSFVRTYPLFESPVGVDTTFINHAHNDYLELLIELGIPGLMLILAFLLWWGKALLAIIRSPGFDRFAAAGAVASASLLVHSLVDFPLRTAALSTLFVACIAAMVLSRRSASRPDDLRPARHVVIG